MRNFKGKSILDDIKDYTVIDIETTGLSSSSSKIIEISAIKVRNKENIDTFTTLINPHRPLNSFIKNLTGITDDMLENSSVEIEEALIKFKEFLKDDIIVGHNVNFDINFLYDNYEKYLNDYLSNDYLDTLRLARKVLDLHHNTLDDLAKFYNIKERSLHRALNDCDMTNQVYLELIKLLKEEEKVV